MLDLLKKQNAFTLLETIVVMAIMSILMIATSDYIGNGFRSIQFGSEQGEAVSNARKAITNISKDVREAARSERGDYPLDTIEEQNFIWYGDINNDGSAEKIKYLLDGSNLIRVVTPPGISNNYDPSNQSTTTIAQYVNNQGEAIFTYYNSSNNETGIINDVRMVNIVLKMNVTPEIAPKDYYIETDIQLRNLKDNL